MTSDFSIPWPRRESWTIAEAACLLARVSPPITAQAVFEAAASDNTDLALLYRELKDATLHGSIAYVDPGGWFGNRRVQPRLCLAWASSKEIGIPDVLGELGELLPVQVGFELDPDMFAEELDAALITYRAVTQRIKRAGAADRKAKELIVEWLAEHYGHLSEATQARIATVCNWDKAGGRPKSG